MHLILKFISIFYNIKLYPITYIYLFIWNSWPNPLISEFRKVIHTKDTPFFINYFTNCWYVKFWVMLIFTRSHCKYHIEKKMLKFCVTKFIDLKNIIVMIIYITGMKRTCPRWTYLCAQRTLSLSHQWWWSIPFYQ